MTRSPTVIKTPRAPAGKRGAAAPCSPDGDDDDCCCCCCCCRGCGGDGRGRVRCWAVSSVRPAARKLATKWPSSGIRCVSCCSSASTSSPLSSLPVLSLLLSASSASMSSWNSRAANRPFMFRAVEEVCRSGLDDRLDVRGYVSRPGDGSSSELSELGHGVRSSAARVAQLHGAAALEAGCAWWAVGNRAAGARGSPMLAVLVELNVASLSLSGVSWVEGVAQVLVLTLLAIG